MTRELTDELEQLSGVKSAEVRDDELIVTRADHERGFLPSGVVRVMLDHGYRPASTPRVSGKPLRVVLQGGRRARP